MKLFLAKAKTLIRHRRKARERAKYFFMVNLAFKTFFLHAVACNLLTINKFVIICGTMSMPPVRK